MQQYRIVLWYANKRRIIKIDADTPLQALKKFKQNVPALVYGAVQIKEIK